MQPLVLILISEFIAQIDISEFVAQSSSNRCTALASQSFFLNFSIFSIDISEFIACN